MADDNKRYAMVCNVCGSDDVSRDAWAAWDARMQEWVLRCAFDDAFCHRCECEVRLLEVELVPAI